MSDAEGGDKVMPGQVSLREYVEALFNEQQRATDMAERERAAATSALRQEQQHAADIAARERSKAAGALATNLAHSISEGDDRLREHIVNQFAQIAAALDSAEKLEVTRLDTLRREMTLIHDGSEKAISKAETAVEKRLEAGNAYRAQLADQASTFMLREVGDAQFDDLRKQVAELTERLGKLT